MLTNYSALLALRTHLLATYTGASSVLGDVAATTTGFSRASGDFTVDGFSIGAEVTPSGFTTTTPAVITALTATVMTVNGLGRTAQSAAVGRTLTTAFPALVAWENVRLLPLAGRWYAEEEFLPGPAEQITLGAFGQVETLPQYVVKVYGVADYGPAALYWAADSVLQDCFPPRTAVTTADGDVLIVRTAPAPYRGQLLQAKPGWAVVTVTIPLRCRSANTI